MTTNDLIEEPNAPFFNWNADWGLRACEEITRLRAENARLTERLTKFNEARERAEAGRDAARADAERYREIKKYAQSGIDMTTNGVKGKTVWKVRLPDASWHSDAWTGLSLDSAIDAALAKL